MLKDLSMQLTPIAKAELEVLQRMKDPSGSHFYLWDFDHYHDQVLHNNYQVDHDMIAEYFPASVTIHSILDIIEEIFSLNIENLTHIRPEQIWHPDVRVFSVQDTESMTFLGFLYLDIYPRDGKFNHAAR